MNYEVPDRENYPLEVLARKLTRVVPSLRDILDQLQNGEVILGFMNLVKEYLPDREEEIMGYSPAGRVWAFCNLFGERYFPLYEDIFDAGYEDGELYYTLVNNIPIYRLAFTWDDYHDLEMIRPGLVALTTLVNSPWLDDDGLKVPMREQAAQLCGESVIKRIPTVGWHPDELEELLKDTEYSFLGMFGHWLHRETGSPWLDMSAEEESYGDLAWSRDLVDYMVEQWPITNRFLDEIHGFAEKLEKNPGLLRHILNTIEQRQRQLALPINVEAKTLMEIFNPDTGGGVDYGEQSVYNLRSARGPGLFHV